MSRQAGDFVSRTGKSSESVLIPETAGKDRYLSVSVEVSAMAAGMQTKHWNTVRESLWLPKKKESR